MNNENLYVILGVLVISLIVVITLLVVANKGVTKKKLNTVKSEEAGDGQHGTNSFLDDLSNFYMSEFTKGKKSGYLVGYENDNVVIDTTDKNILLVGSPGSGKTASSFIPNIYYNGYVEKNSSKGCNFIFTDLKSTLFNETSGFLDQCGYNILKLDFRNPEYSNKYNVISSINYYYDKWIESEKKNTKYYAIFEKECDILADGLSPKENKNDKNPFFDDASNGLIKILIMIQATKEERNLPSLIASFGSNDNKDYINRHVKVLPRLSTIAKAYLSAPDETLGSIESTAANKLNKFNSKDVEVILNDNSTSNVEDLTEKPYAIYIIVPDEDPTKNPFASLIIRQLYNKLIYYAENYNGALPRPWYCYFDEFGNMPKIEYFDTILTAVRSRGIKTILSVQSEHQLDFKYGKEGANVLKSALQCLQFSAIPYTDFDGAKKMSERCGVKTILSATTTSGSSNNNFDFFARNLNRSTTYQLMQRNLMNTDEISRMKLGEWIWLETGVEPYQTKLNYYKEMDDIEIIKPIEVKMSIKEGTALQECSVEIEEHNSEKELVKLKELRSLIEKTTKS